MNSLPSVQIVRLEDWECVWINGKYFDSTHSVSKSSILKTLLGDRFTQVIEPEFDDDTQTFMIDGVSVVDESGEPVGDWPFPIVEQ